MEDKNPKTGRKTPWCWTVLCQDFKNSPIIFGNQLAKELEGWQHKRLEATLHQCADELLIGAESREEITQVTSLLNFPSSVGCRVSKKKAPIACQFVIYVGFTIPRGYQSLMGELKEAVCQIPGRDQRAISLDNWTKKYRVDVLFTSSGSRPEALPECWPTPQPAADLGLPTCPKHSDILKLTKTTPERTGAASLTSTTLCIGNTAPCWCRSQNPAQPEPGRGEEGMGWLLGGRDPCGCSP